MRTHLFPLSLFLVPSIAFALEISPGNLYPDVRSSSPEAAGINLLTRTNVVQGYADGRFGPSRLVNRAEFLKMAIASAGFDTSDYGDTGCFPDVPAGAWFTPYVCAAKDRGVVKGNPDGLFHPDRTVQYDEALKMLTLLYAYDIPETSGTDWVEPYYQAAVEHKVDLTVRTQFAMPLTRGLSARLIGAFLAESEGELTNFRLAENNRYDLISSSGSSSSSSSSSSSVSSSSSSMSSSLSSSSFSSSVASSLYTLPPVSHFLLTGKKSDAVASITLKSVGEQAYVSAVQLKTFSEVRSLESIELTTETGTVVATLMRRTNTDTDDYKQTFEAQIAAEKQYLLPADTDTRLVVRAVVRTPANAGFSDELMQVRTLNVTIRGAKTNETKNIPAVGPFPKHQTAFGRILSVVRTSPTTDTIRSGTGLSILAFSLTGTGDVMRSLQLTQATFSVARTGNVKTANWTLRRVGTPAAVVACTQNDQAATVTCPLLKEVIGSIPWTGPLGLELVADITVPVGSTGNSIQASLPSPGSPESLGGIEWTDGSGMFRWVEGVTPLLTGTVWR